MTADAAGDPRGIFHVAADDIALGVDSPRVSIHGTRVIDRCETPVLEQEPMGLARAVHVPADHGASSVDVRGGRGCSSGDIERNKPLCGSGCS
jgi:hypothetical protein